MKKGIICYDVNLKPSGMDFEKLLGVVEKHGYLFYDSFEDPNVKPPYMLNPEEELTKVLIDVSTEDGKKILKQLKDEKIH